MKTAYSLLINIVVVNALTSINCSAQQWNVLPNSPIGFVSAFVVDSSNSSLVVGGAFTNTGPLQNWYIAAWNGNAWSQFGTGNHFNGGTAIYTLATFNNQIYAGGDFNGPSNLIAGWDGLNWFSINNLITGGTFPSGTSSEIKAIKPFNNKLYVTGAFRWKDYLTIPDTVNSLITWDGLTCNKLADITGNKIGLSKFPTSIGFIGTSLHEFNNELYLAGVFDSVCGIGTPSFVAKTDGQNWYPVGNSTIPLLPYCISDYNNNLILGGSGNAIWKYDGVSWIQFADIQGQNPVIFAMTKYQGDLIIAGKFDSIESVAAKNIARWNGTSWSPIGSGLSNSINSSVVYALAEYQNNLYVGGSFSMAGGLPASNIAYWSEPTSLTELNSPTKFTIYPNPSSAEVSIHFQETSDIVTLIIVNSQGSIIYNQPIFKLPLDEGSFTLYGLSSGMYCVILMNSNGFTYKQKLIIIE